jgi:hypothetical protein
MKKKLVLLCSAIVATFANSACAVEGVVLWNNVKCGVNIIATDGGYTFNQQVSAAELSVGDKLEGPLNVAEKTNNFTNVTTGKNVMIWVGRYSTSKKIILEWVPPKCRTEDLMTMSWVPAQ